jgi:hypothetical protein
MVRVVAMNMMKCFLVLEGNLERDIEKGKSLKMEKYMSGNLYF